MKGQTANVHADWKSDLEGFYTTHVDSHQLYSVDNKQSLPFCAKASNGKCCLRISETICH